MCDEVFRNQLASSHTCASVNLGMWASTDMLHPSVHALSCLLVPDCMYSYMHGQSVCMWVVRAVDPVHHAHPESWYVGARPIEPVHSSVSILPVHTCLSVCVRFVQLDVFMCLLAVHAVT